MSDQPPSCWTCQHWVKSESNFPSWRHLCGLDNDWHAEPCVDGYVREPGSDDEAIADADLPR